jgi:hypothetical protein
MYVLGYLKAMLEDPNKRMTFQTIMYDIRLVQLLLDFIKYLYNLTLKQSAKEHLMPLEIHIAKIFKEMHIIFTLSCSNNSYNKQMILKEGARNCSFSRSKAKVGLWTSSWILSEKFS